MTTRREALIAAALLMGPALSLAQGRGPVPRGSLSLLSYYDYPPFSTGPHEGLNFELQAWLRQRSDSPLDSCELEVLPRRRVNARVEAPGWSGLVPWVAPSWFKDPDRKLFVWSAPVLDDEDLVLSLRRNPLLFDGMASLRGRTLGGVFGHVYADADPLAERGELRRFDSFTQEANLRMLLAGRVDAIFLSRSGLPWWRQRFPEFDEQLQVSLKPRMRYQRHLMLSPLLPDGLREWLLDAAAQMGSDPAWREALRRYGLPVAGAERQEARQA
ncbi:hypothetical protein RQP53_19110 [Paucibacter sp. APW11]|uniref:Solute-binding protein family 3/N-terminal domain-containing protein n=1 Tax=Roseateles aquae TaxID=3077235 RepID=A0ABU3PFU1_9BURK|nr:transporter substrate-binding domain-containing protein [Paucibacter sp. APW11]MDT9001398.1 hypothetical protein [Paucibacter sp. APW11]